MTSGVIYIIPQAKGCGMMAKELAAQAAAYLREEADFNRSFVDGRRRPEADPGYIARRLEIANIRDAWASAIEALTKNETQE